MGLSFTPPYLGHLISTRSKTIQPQLTGFETFDAGSVEVVAARDLSRARFVDAQMSKFYWRTSCIPRRFRFLPNIHRHFSWKRKETLVTLFTFACSLYNTGANRRFRDQSLVSKLSP